MTTRLAWAVIVLLTTYLTFIGGGWLGIYAADLRIASVTAAGLALVTWFVLMARRPSWRPRSALWPAIAAALGSLAISTLFSRVPRMSVEYLAYAVILVALYLLLVRLMAHRFFERRLLTLGAMYFVAITGLFLVLVAVHWIDWWSTLGRIAIPPLRPDFEGLTYLNPSAVLTVAALFAVPAAAMQDPATSRGRLGLAGIFLVVLTVALLTGSRAGWLAIAVTGVVGGVAALFNPSARAAVRGALRQATSSRAARTVMSVVLVGGVAAAVVLTPAILRRISEGGEDLRAQYVVTSLRIFAVAPVVGTGPGTWVIQRLANTSAGEPDYYIPHAHNVGAQTLAELGIVGAVAGFVLIAALGLLLLRAVRSPDPLRRRIGWLTALGLVYFGAHQVLDFYANMPAALFAAAIPIAYLDATSPRPEVDGGLPAAPRAPGGAALRAAVAGIVIAAAVGSAIGDLPSLEGQRAVELADAGSWAEADPLARDAATRDPNVSSLAFTAGLTASHVGDHAAAATYFVAVAASDDLPEAWLNLAAEQSILGDQAQAQQSLERALRLGIQRPAIAFPAAELAMRISAPDLAIDPFVVVASVRPSILGDPWWQATEARRQMWQTIVVLAGEASGPGSRWEIALQSGDAEDARRFAMSPGVHPATIDFVDAWNGDERAYARLVDRCRDTPLDLTALAFCARIEARRGNTDRANDYRRLAATQIGGAERAGAELRVASAADVGIAGDPATFWGTFTYRRPTPRDMLVPSLAHLTLR